MNVGDTVYAVVKADDLINLTVKECTIVSMGTEIILKHPKNKLITMQYTSPIEIAHKWVFADERAALAQMEADIKAQSWNGGN